MEEKRSTYKRIKMSLIIAGIIAVFIFTDIYRCPVRAIFKIPCPCCGMTRAIMAAIRMEWKLSFYYHPLWPIIVVAILVHVLYEFRIIKLSKKQTDIGLIFISSLLMLCYVIRILASWRGI